MDIKMPVKKASGPIVTQKMMDTWNKTTEITNELSITTKERLEKITIRVCELEKKSGDYALKTDLEKTQADVNSLQA
jgi:predicted type IV restriction endonuclease